jgi:hypothetical protein
MLDRKPKNASGINAARRTPGFSVSRKYLFRWGIIGLCALAGCSSPATARVSPADPAPSASAADQTAAPSTLDPTVAPTLADTATPTPTATPAILNPLTGLPVSDISLIQRRPLAIKVSNFPRTARPQAGLSSADLLFEFYQEYGMTRWQAIYLSRDAEKVGPIRSGRRIDVPLMRAYQSALVFCAEYDTTWDYMEDEGVRNLLMYVGPVGCPALCRDNNQIPINGIYGNTAELRKAEKVLKIPDIVPNLAGMEFQDQPPAMSGTGTDLAVHYLGNFATAEWRFNPSDGKYYRWSETDSGKMAPLTDRLTGEQLSVSNLIVVYVNYIQRNGDQIYELELYGGGRALLFRDGLEEEGIWRLPKMDRPLQFFGPDGPFYLKPGVSWITLVEDSSTDSHSGGTWDVRFGQPTPGT